MGLAICGICKIVSFFWLNTFLNPISMHAAQTAWLADRQNRPDFTGGWLAAKFHLYSWALSAHCLAW
jgi:hypothetical protein